MGQDIKKNKKNRNRAQGQDIDHGFVPQGPLKPGTFKRLMDNILHLITSDGPLVTDQINNLANILTIIETRNKTNPISIKADWYI